MFEAIEEKYKKMIKTTEISWIWWKNQSEER